MFDLTNSQNQLVDKVKKWFNNWESGLRVGDHPQWFAYTGAAGTGKALPDDTIIPTPEGYRRFHTLQVGDRVFNLSGKPVKILGVYPQGIKDVYKLTFSDGRIAHSCNEHLWTILEDNGLVTKPLNELIENFSPDKYKIPSPGEAEFNHVETPIFPHYYGSSIDKNAESNQIPNIYKINSALARRMLLVGLMDKDSKETKFTVKSVKLRDDIREVLYSLGYQVEEIHENDTYILKAFKKGYISIINIEYVGQCSQRCIYVDDPLHIFLTENFVPTHNTTVAKAILSVLGLDKRSYIAVAYVGKAVMRMQQTGLSAKTIHSLIYDILPVMKENPVTHKKYLSFEFFLKEKLNDNLRLIIVDEATMVNEDLQRELLSFGLPILFMGDMNQLPPVFGVSTVMMKPDHVLIEIMRQNENDPIVILANMVLNDIPLLEGTYGKSKVIKDFEITNSFLTDYDQAICVTNKLRSEINHIVRYDLKHFTTDEPRLFDKIVCRQNNWGISLDGFNLTNGLAGHITDISRHSLSKGYYTIDFQPDFLEPGREFLGLKMDAKYITAPYDKQKMMNRLKYEKFEYAYAITCYTAQGSEWNNVIYFDSWFHDAELTKKSRYTGISRARESITIVSRARKG